MGNRSFAHSSSWQSLLHLGNKVKCFVRRGGGGEGEKVKVCIFNSLKKYYHFALKEMKHILYEILLSS